MGTFTDWQNGEVTASALDSNAIRIDFKLKRIMVDFANILIDKGEKEAMKALECNEFDFKNWKKDYPRYSEYLHLRSEARIFSESVNKDFVYMLLGKAAQGLVNLSAPQVGALRLIMQGKGFVAANGAQMKPKGKASSFSISEKGEDEEEEL
jgi:hypothetical protein